MSAEEIPDTTDDAAAAGAVVAALPVVIEPKITPMRVPDAMPAAVEPAVPTEDGGSGDATAATTSRMTLPTAAPTKVAAQASPTAAAIDPREPASHTREDAAPVTARPAQDGQISSDPDDTDSSTASSTASIEVDAPAAREHARQSAAEASRAQQSKAATAARTAADPLAKLMESARVVVERSASDRSGASASAQAIAGRLNEVEASVARDRVTKAIDGGFLQRAEAATATTSSATAATASMNANAAQSATGPAVPAGATLPTDAGTAGAAPAPDLALPTEADAHPSAQLAAKGIAILGNQRGGAITMRLEPPALGQLRIELQIQQGAVVADFTAATPEARVLLEANLGMLRERLESQGLSVERISVHGGRGTESASPVAAPAGSDARQDGAGARSDSGDRGDRSGARQDAAGGESRGRRDGDARAQRDRMDAARTGEPRGFAAALHGETALRTEPMRRAG